MNYKCSLPKQWLGLENEQLQAATGLASAGFCHKGGFLMTVGDEADTIRACDISLEEYLKELQNSLKDMAERLKETNGWSEENNYGIVEQ